MTCKKCNYWAFTIVGVDKKQCNRCGTVQRHYDRYPCDQCGEVLTDDNDLQHYKQQHPQLIEGVGTGN